MSERSVEHATFVVERTYDASPARVFAAWADPEAKARWFAGADDEGGGAEEFELDFRIGGREISRGGPDGGPVFVFDARYQDIVPGQPTQREQGTGSLLDALGVELRREPTG
jgi:uncharacterized protein YndB with AHSA1/START domain